MAIWLLFYSSIKLCYLLLLIEAEAASIPLNLVLKDWTLDFQHALVLDQLINLVYHIIDHACLLFYEFLFFSDVFNDLIGKDGLWDFECLGKVFYALIKLLKVDGIPEFDLQFFSLVR